MKVGLRYYLSETDAEILKSQGQMTKVLMPYITRYIQQHKYLLDRYEIIYGDIYVHPLGVKTSKHTPDV